MFRISGLLKTSDEIANSLPNILSESAVLARSTLQGLHSSRFAGKGEAFWQFKDYKQGDNVTSIDWRKSAALNKILVKEKENETSKIIYFYYDKTKSMSFKSSKIFKSKYYISVLMTLTLSRIFLKNRENIFHFKKNDNVIRCSHNLTSFNKTFLSEESENYLPDIPLIKNNSMLFIFSDFFYDFIVLEKFMHKMKNRNISGYIIQILDPMEINFQIKENLILNDMETNEKLIVGNSERYEKMYKKNLNKLQNNLMALCINNNWNFMFHKTTDSLKPLLLQIVKNITLKKN